MPDESWKARPNCKGTGHVDAPSHSVEQNVFNVPDVSTHICPGCSSCRCSCGHMRGEHHVEGDGRSTGRCLYDACTCRDFSRKTGVDRAKHLRPREG